MVDPCDKCETIEERNRFLRQNQFQLSRIFNNSENSPIFQPVDSPSVSKEQITAILESSTDCILVWDKDYNYLYANQAAIDHVNTTRDKVIGKNIRDGLGHIPNFMKLWMSRVDEVFKTAKPMRVEDAVSVGDKVVHSESVLSPICYASGDMFAVGVVYRDVTEKRQLEQNLVDSEKKYQQLYEKAQAALYRTRISDGKIIMCNEALAKMIGFDSTEECLRSGFNTSTHYVDKNRRQKLLEILKKEKKVNGFQAETFRKDGTTMWISLSAELFPEQGYLEGTITDITLSKVLSKSEKRILEIIMQGKTNKEIAKILKRSVRTVEDHRAHIMQKLGAKNLVELATIVSSADLNL